MHKLSRSIFYISTMHDLVYAEPVVIVGALETLVPGLTTVRAAARGAGGQGRGRARRPTSVDIV